MRLALLALTALVLAGCSPKPGVRACLLPPSGPPVGGRFEASHRDFQLPVVTYTKGHKAPRNFGFYADLAVRPDGRIACYSTDERLTPQRRAALAGLANVRYRPFLKNGRAVAVSAFTTIYEQRLPARHVPPPQGAPETFAIRLARGGGCFGACPVYRVSISGDGRAIYDGQANVLFAGHHETQVSPQDIDRLRNAVTGADIWSLDDAYVVAHPAEAASDTISVTMGGQTKTIRDHLGDRVGMPLAARQLEDLVDEVSGARSFVRGDATTADRLVAEHYDFTSHEANDALARLSGTAPLPVVATFLDHGADATIALKMGAGAGRSDVFELAASHMTSVDDQILCTVEHDASGSGNARLFMTIAARAPKGCKASDDLTATFVAPEEYNEIFDGEYCPRHDTVPYCFRPDRYTIVQYLLAHGADVYAPIYDKSFVYTAVGDTRIRQLFIDRGFDPNRLQPDGSHILLEDYSEDTALFDLDHGADPAVKSADGEDFAARARAAGWWRVQWWLWQHGGRRKA